MTIHAPIHRRLTEIGRHCAVVVAVLVSVVVVVVVRVVLATEPVTDTFAGQLELQTCNQICVRRWDVFIVGSALLSTAIPESIFSAPPVLLLLASSPVVL